MLFVTKHADISQAAQAAIPIVLGYIAIGVPCGVLSASIGLDPLQVFLLSVLFYSGTGQFMIPNMWLAGSPLVSIVLSVGLINSRHILYSVSLAHHAQNIKKRLAFFFAATVTDESFGLSTQEFCDNEDWTVKHAFVVNLCALITWTLANVAGVVLGQALSVPIAISSFAMTSIFICLLVIQDKTLENIAAALIALLSVFTCKTIGLEGPAILIGSLLGVMAALLVNWMKGGGSQHD